MENPAPYEILGAPFELWVAPVGTVFPTVDAAPSGSWTKVGTSGDLNYAEAGVTVEHKQSLTPFRALGSTGPRKVFRANEDLTIKLELADLSPAQYATIMNGNAVTTVSAGVGVAGTKKLGLSQGTTVTQHALLLRGPSPAMENGTAQYEVPVAVQSGNPAPVFKKDAPAALAIEFMALEDPNAASPDERFGRFIAETAPAS